MMKCDMGKWPKDIDSQDMDVTIAVFDSSRKMFQILCLGLQKINIHSGTSETCKGSCCWKGPSYGVSGGDDIHMADGVDTVSDCAKMCDEMENCRVFLYNGSMDTNSP